MRFFIGAKMAIYEREELEEKIRTLDEKIENEDPYFVSLKINLENMLKKKVSKVNFFDLEEIEKVSEWTKQRDRYQQMLNELLAETRQRVKRHRIKYARF